MLKKISSAKRRAYQRNMRQVWRETPIEERDFFGKDLNHVADFAAGMGPNAAPKFYQIPMRWLKKVLRALALDYGSFSGAVLGAVGTAVVGLFAWLGVQGQINLQNTSNNIAAVTYIRADLDKLYARYTSLSRVKASLDTNFPLIEKINQYDNWPRLKSGVLNQNIYWAFRDFSLIPDEQALELSRGSGGTLGLLYFTYQSNVVKLLAEYKNLNALDKSKEPIEIVRGLQEPILEVIDRYKLALIGSKGFANNLDKELEQTRREIDQREDQIKKLDKIIAE